MPSKEEKKLVTIEGAVIPVDLAPPSDQACSH